MEHWKKNKEKVILRCAVGVKNPIKATQTLLPSVTETKHKYVQDNLHGIDTVHHCVAIYLEMLLGSR